MPPPQTAGLLAAWRVRLQPQDTHTAQHQQFTRPTVKQEARIGIAESIPRFA